MEIRKLTTAEERYDASLVSTIAFHVRTNDESLEKRKAEPYDASYDDWGALTERGEIAAHMLNHFKKSRFDGHIIANGGIGAVSTAPEYRQSGAVRAIFEKMLPDSLARSDVISTLYPFNHAFYRKFGYETIVRGYEYDIPSSALSNFRHDGWVKMWHPGETVELFTPIYEAFARRYNLAIERTDAYMAEEHIKGLYYKDRRFCYLIGDDQGACAYVVFDDIYQNPMAKMQIADLAFIERRGLMALLGFLARFSADYMNIIMPLPTDISLLKLLNDPYAVSQKPMCDYMARVINAKELLSKMSKPEGAAFTVAVSDPIIAENNGTFAVEGDKAELTNAEPDIILSERAFIQLALGSSDLDEASLRPDVEIIKNTDTLRKVFVRKPIYTADHF